MLIAQGEAVAAVKALNGYLSDFAADSEAWLQLAKLHVDALNYEVCRTYLLCAHKYDCVWQIISPDPRLFRGYGWNR